MKTTLALTAIFIACSVFGKRWRLSAAALLLSDAYNYSLCLNNLLVDTKQMILAK